MHHRIFLSALGIVSALGSSKKDSFENLIAGNVENVIWRDDFFADKKIRLACVVDDLPKIPAGFEDYNTRCNQILLSSYLQIENEVEAAITKYSKDRIAVVIGCSTSGIDETQLAFDEHFQSGNYPQNFDPAFLEMGNPAKFLSQFAGLNGIAYTVSTACSSGAKAFVSARNLIDMNLCDAVLVGGTDSLCKLTVQGFAALESTATDISNPFSANRDGITIGEGSALFLLTKEKSEIELLGIGESSDAYHNVAPDPQGLGALVSMKEALQKSGLKAEDVDYVNLHGTGTKLNDGMESLAVNNLFGDRVYCSSTKPLTGHTLGSSGIIEIGLCWLLLQNFNAEKKLPPHVWDGEFDAELPKLNFVGIDKKARKLRVCLSNSFAFGGSNSSVIIRKIT